MALPETVTLAGPRLTVELDATDGAKVSGLRCARHGRQWLHGPPPAAADDGFGPSRSWGWDELFPTVLGTDAAPAPWPRRLRDHGELWGRPWTPAPDRARLCFEAPGRFRFTRSLAVVGRTVTATYSLRNLGDEAFAWMWAMHPILAIEPGDRLELPGVRAVQATYVRPDRAAEGRTLEWPVATIADVPVRLDRLGPPDGATALKLYAEARTAVVHGRRCRLTVTTDMPYLGIYLNLGGWPDAGSGLHQLGVEPTTAPVDDLATAVERGLARMARPGETLRWMAAMRVD